MNAAWRRIVIFVVCTVLMLTVPAPAHAYLKFGVDVGNTTKTLRWVNSPVTYYVTNQGIAGVSATAFQAAVTKAFNTWEAVPTASVSYRFGGFTAHLPGDDDGLSTLGFLNEPSLDRVLASTGFLLDDLTGELLESDIFFNAAFPWSAEDTGVANRWDLQTIAVHEIGHLNGLGHSALGETEPSGTGRRVLSTGAVMFPIALGLGDISARTLMPDDIAGISDIYPTAQFSRTTGSISGHVTKSGAGVFGAHVVAVNLANGQQVGNFVLDDDGQFSIAGLKPGPYILRIEPIDDADLESFFGGGEAVDASFNGRFFERIVVAPRGGDSGLIEIAVTPR
jgi:hypothetical protein